MTCANKFPKSVPGLFSYQSVSLAYLPRPDPANGFFPVSPEIATQNGNYAKVPLISGDQEDEGPLFSLVQSNISTTQQLVDYVDSAYPDTPRSLAAALVATYPDDITAGSPFRTGLLNNIYPQYKRLAAILGDAVFNLRRRQMLYTVSSTISSAFSSVLEALLFKRLTSTITLRSSTFWTPMLLVLQHRSSIGLSTILPHLRC
jgi:hypothetical protein